MNIKDKIEHTLDSMGMGMVRDTKLLDALYEVYNIDDLDAKNVLYGMLCKGHACFMLADNRQFVLMPISVAVPSIDAGFIERSIYTAGQGTADEIRRWSNRPLMQPKDVNRALYSLYRQGKVTIHYQGENTFVFKWVA